MSTFYFDDGVVPDVLSSIGFDPVLEWAAEQARQKGSRLYALDAKGSARVWVCRVFHYYIPDGYVGDPCSHINERCGWAWIVEHDA